MIFLFIVIRLFLLNYQLSDYHLFAIDNIQTFAR